MPRISEEFKYQDEKSMKGKWVFVGLILVNDVLDRNLDLQFLNVI